MNNTIFVIMDRYTSKYDHYLTTLDDNWNAKEFMSNAYHEIDIEQDEETEDENKRDPLTSKPPSRKWDIEPDADNTVEDKSGKNQIEMISNEMEEFNSGEAE